MTIRKMVEAMSASSIVKPRGARGRDTACRGVMGYLSDRRGQRLQLDLVRTPPIGPVYRHGDLPKGWVAAGVGSDGGHRHGPISTRDASPGRQVYIDVVGPLGNVAASHEVAGIPGDRRVGSVKGEGTRGPGVHAVVQAELAEGVILGHLDHFLGQRCRLGD